MGCLDVLDGLPGDGKSREDQKNHHGKGDQRLGFSVSIGMVFIGRTRRIAETKQDQQGRKNIHGGLNPVRNQRIGIPKNPTQKLDYCQNGVSQHAKNDGSNGEVRRGHAVKVRITNDDLRDGEGKESSSFSD